jgi:hypothetical protein
MIKNKIAIIFLSVLALLIFTNITFAASTPTLNLINNTSTVGINVTGADPYATVNFYYPNPDSNNNSVNISYISIGIGQTDSSGSFNVSVSPNSYGLSGGMQIYVSVDGASSSHISWPASSIVTSQSGALQLSEQNATLTVGGTATVMGMNTSNNLTVQSNSNNSVVAAFTQSSNNSVIINALATGSSIVSICAGTAGCSTISVSVLAPTQTITFSQSSVYLTLGNPAQTISIYGPGSGYTVSNQNQNMLTTSLDGSNILLQGLSLGQITISVCANGWLCGSLPIYIVSPGTAVPYQVSAPPPANSNFSQPPQLTSLSISSNDSPNLFFGTNSTISISFAINQTVSNVQATIDGQQTSADQGSNGTYSISYRMTGNEALPLQVAISYTNPSGIVGKTYFSIGNSATTLSATATPVTTTTASASTTAVNCPVGLICMPTATPVPAQGLVNTSSSSYTFNNYLYMGMNKIGQSDPDVVALQKRLTTDGLFKSYATGYFGPLTKTAVQAYQTKHGLSPLGVVGPATRNLLNEGI